MKTIYEHEIGGDGGMTGAYLNGGQVFVRVSYPVTKLVDPVMAQLDPLKEKLKSIVPFDSATDPLIDAAFAEAKAEIIKLLSE